ncbi:MAG TPA: hypothetical protein VMD29_09700 [Terracidiphilus sp.]|nr:hypothetical protein [Terracidiphilus sp.]
MEKLAGRLNWERTANGIRVEIPARRDWTTAFFTIWLCGWTLAGKAALHQAFPKGNGSAVEWFSLLWLAGWAFGECFVTVAIIWALGGRTLVVLDPEALEIEHSLLSIHLNRRVTATSDVRNLRFMPATASGRSSRASNLSFESGDKTVRFATGISDAEALSLINKMLDVYPFPKERALEYLDLSR